MISFVLSHPYTFTIIATLFLIGVIIMVYEIRRAVKVPDDKAEE